MALTAIWRIFFNSSKRKANVSELRLSGGNLKEKNRKENEKKEKVWRTWVDFTSIKMETTKKKEAKIDID